MLSSHYGNILAVYRLPVRLSTAVGGRGDNAMTGKRSRSNREIIVLVGLMGSGKSSVGRRLSKRLGLPFTDADAEIVKAAGCSIEDIFELYGEEAFRDGERRVIARLLGDGPQVLATGGGAFMDPETRSRIGDHGVSVWLRADLDVLVKRIGRRGGRPLLKDGDPRDILKDLMETRDPFYAQADIAVDTGDEPPDATVDEIVVALEAHSKITSGQGDAEP
jgi:shikimate kinase